MKKSLRIIVLLFSVLAAAQPKFEMSPRGFAPIELQNPNRPNTELVQMVKAWATAYNEKGADVYDITENSLTIEALNHNAFYYLNRGETYKFDIKYVLKVVFKPGNKYTLAFSVKEIYDNQILLKTNIAGFYAPDGRLKEDYEEVKPSLEFTANEIARSFSSYLTVN
jgi:hypothetical protein